MPSHLCYHPVHAKFDVIHHNHRSAEPEEIFHTIASLLNDENGEIAMEQTKILTKG